MRKKTVAAFVAAAILVYPAIAEADSTPPPEIATQLGSAAHVETEGGTELDLPPGWWIVPPDVFAEIDERLKRAENQVTGLTAERDHLRQALRDTRPAWYYVAGALAIGFAAGTVYGATR